MTAKYYKYKQPNDTWFYQIALIVLICLYGFILVREIIRLTIDYSSKKLILLLVMTLIISVVIYIMHQIISMFKEYEVIDRNKEIIIDNKDRKVTIRKGVSEMTLLHENIENAEIFESWATTYPLGFFRFIKLRTKTGENITITGFTIPLLESELRSVLKGIKMKWHRRFINRIE